MRTRANWPQQRFPEIESKGKQQMMAYRELSNEELFKEQWVTVELPPNELPGFKGERGDLPGVWRRGEFWPLHRAGWAAALRELRPAGAALLASGLSLPEG